LNSARIWVRRGVLVRSLVSQLNEVCKNIDGSPTKYKRDKLHRLVRNLITKATIGDDRIGPKGEIIEGTGDTTAILALIDRIEGRPSQKVVGADNGPVKVEFKTVEEVHMFLLERGIDAMRVPPLPLRIIDQGDN
jgi:hypothetical protein